MNTQPIRIGIAGIIAFTSVGVVLGPRALSQGQANHNRRSTDTSQQQNANRPTEVTGTITAGNASANTITIRTQPGGIVGVIQVTSSTRIVTHVQVALSAVKVGDEIHLIQAQNAVTPAGRTQAPGVAGSRALNAQRSAGQSNQMLTGLVSAVNPLTLQVPGLGTIIPNVSNNARVIKIVPMLFSNLQVGYRVMATGQLASDGSLTATRIVVETASNGASNGASGAASGAGTGRNAAQGSRAGGR